MEKQKSLLHYVSGADSGACFSSLTFLDLCITQAANADSVVGACTHALSLSPSWKQTQPFRLGRSITQHSFRCLTQWVSAGPWDCFCCYCSLPTVLLLHLLLVASLRLAPALSFAERRWQAATQLVGESIWIERHAAVARGGAEIRGVFWVIGSFSAACRLPRLDHYVVKELEGQDRQQRWKGTF